MPKLNTLLMYLNNHEDTSWGCLAFHSQTGYDSIQEMVEEIANAFNKVLTDEVNECSGPYCCSAARRYRKLKICDKCGKDTTPEPITKRMVENEFRTLAEGTYQNFADLWEELQSVGLEVGFKGNAGMTACTYWSSELIAQTLFGGFKVEYEGEGVHRCHTVPLYKKQRGKRK
jgi:hypothetical protein